MSFTFQDDKHVLNENQFGVQNSLVFGLKHVKDSLTQSHPLAHREVNRDLLEEKEELSRLSIIQGQHASFKLSHEFEFARKVGRLPCLKSSNLMLDVLRGNDETIDVKDIFNNQREFREYNIDPHSELYKIKY